MNASQLKYNVEKRGGNFFSRDSMRFFGDRMSNYGVRETTVRTNYDTQDNWIENGIEFAVFELYRKHPVNHGLQTSAYFEKITFQRVYPAR